jgi:hypothetical protein
MTQDEGQIIQRCSSSISSSPVYGAKIRKRCHRAARTEGVFGSPPIAPSGHFPHKWRKTKHNRTSFLPPLAGEVGAKRSKGAERSDDQGHSPSTTSWSPSPRKRGRKENKPASTLPLRQLLCFSLARHDVQGFDDQREGDGEVEIAARDVEAETVGDQGHTDQENKRQR